MAKQTKGLAENSHQCGAGGSGARGLRKGDRIIVTRGEHRGTAGLYCGRRPEGKVLIEIKAPEGLREWIGVKAGNVKPQEDIVGGEQITESAD